MKGSSFASIRRIFWLGILVVLVLAGCGPSAVTLTPTMAPATAAVTETAPAATPTTPTSSIVRRDNDTGWRHYWASSSQQVFVNALAIDGQWLWIATTKGMIRLNQHTLEYQLYPSTGTSPDMALDRVYTLAVDDQGRLWAGGSRGLARYTNTTGWKMIYTGGSVTKYIGGSVTNFALDHEGNLWYWKYSSDRRFRPTVYRFQGQEPPAVGDWQPEQVEWQDSFIIPSNWRFLALESGVLPNEQSGKDASGNTWSWEYSWRYGELVIYRNGQVIHTIIQASSNYAVIVAEAGVWIRLWGNRLFYSDGQSLQLGGWLDVPSDLSGSRLFYSDGQSLQQYRFADGKASISPPRVSSLAFTADGNGWATTSEGLFRFSNGTEKWERKKMNTTLKEAAFRLVVSDQQSNLWAYYDMYDHAYFAYFDGPLWRIWPITLDRCRWDGLRTATEYQGDVWFTTFDEDCGLWHFDGQTFENFELPPIHSLTTDHNTKLYAIDTKGAILIYDGTAWQQLPDCTECNELGLKLDYAIAIDATGRVWRTNRYTTLDASTHRYYETYSIWRYSADQGWCHILTLDPGPYVRSLLIDAYGDLWILLSSDEVLRCNQENCEAWRFGDDQPFDAPITAMAMDSQGRIWFGGYGLLSVYDPAAER